MEILAPGGDIDSIKSAIIAGADAIYCGLNKFNARNRAENIAFDDLNGIIRLAHQFCCRVYLTLNINIVEQELPDLFRWLNRIVNTAVDGIIVQDIGLFYLINQFFPSLKIHASTQLTTHNTGQVKFLKKLSAIRVNLSRELSLSEIETITAFAKSINVESEVFVHGSYCISFSGICYMSSFFNGNSGNRGRCSQPCRDEFIKTKQGSNYPLNLKDNSAFFNLKELYDAGVDSIKIEGRIKQFHYVHTVVDAYRKQLDFIYNGKDQILDNSMLFKVFNRNFSTGYLSNKIGEKMFIDQPRDYSSTYLALKRGEANMDNLEWAEEKLYREKGEMRARIKEKIDRINHGPVPINLHVSGKEGSPLAVKIDIEGASHIFLTKSNLQCKGKVALDRKMLMKRFKAIDDTEFYIKKINRKDLGAELYISFKELTALKNNIVYRLMGNREKLAQIPMQQIASEVKSVKPILGVLIDSKDDVELSKNVKGTFYFQVPSAIGAHLDEWGLFFEMNPQLIPWFSSILMEKDYNDAIDFLRRVKPKEIVCNNTGVAFAAMELGIAWIAGPNLNNMNSFALQGLKEYFNCKGAFLSNELSMKQLKAIKKPINFDLFFSIYHPVELMTSRQCLFQTTLGCTKKEIDDACLDSCNKETVIRNLKEETLYLQKTKGNYQSVLFEHNYLNMDVISDLPDTFSCFFIDLRNQSTNTTVLVKKSKLIQYFDSVISGNKEAKSQLGKLIFPTNNQQYYKGV